MAIKLAYAIHFVADMDRAVAFYRDGLGLSVGSRHGDEWAELEAGPITIGLHGARDRRETPHGGTAVFRVADLDLAKAALEERGGVFEEHMGEVPGIARYASFGDPDGNSMQLIEYAAPGGASPVAGA